MRVAVYVRVSTQRQAQAQTIEQQLDRLRAHLDAQDVALASENIFRDDGYSGATLNRPGLDRLRDVVRAGEVDRVLVTDPDRLARNYVQLMVLLEELERFGCEVAFLDRPMSWDPQDQLLLQIRGAVAEYERTLIAERMRRGRQTKLRAGCLLPWTRPPYGYRLDPDRPRDPAGVTLEAAEAAVIRELFAGYLEDHVSLFSLAKHLQALGIASPTGRPRWSPTTLRGLLTNPTYTGQVYAGRWRTRAPRLRRSATHPIGKPSDSPVPVPPAEWLPVASVPALVGEEQFARVQAKLAQNRAFAWRHNTRHAYLLRALVSCGLCRSSCLCRTVHPGYAYYTCRGKGDPLHSRRDEPCPARYAPAAQLDDLVWRDLCELLINPELIAQALARAHGGGWLPQELQARREQLRQGRLTLERQLERLTEAYRLAVIPLPEYQRRRQALEQRLQALSMQAGQLEAQVDRQAELAGWAASAADFCRRVRAGLAGADFAQRRQLVELLIDRVLVTDGEVEIRYVIPLSPGSAKVRFGHLRKDYFDHVALAVQAPVHEPGCPLGPELRDDGADAVPPEVVPHGPARVALVAHDRPRPELRPSAAGALDRAQPHQLAAGGLLVALARGHHERHRSAAAIAADVQLAAEAAARAAQRLAEPPPFPPAAQRCARTLVPSTMCTSPSRCHPWRP
jgi:site-specific DNA recombinase